MISKEISELPSPIITLNNRLDSKEYYDRCPFGRTDIAIVRFWDVANCFIHIKKEGGYKVHVDLWSGIVTDKDGIKLLEETALNEFINHTPTKYSEDHRKFFTEIRLKWWS